MTKWEVVLHEEVEAWFIRLCEDDPGSADQVEKAIDCLAREGPPLGRPLVDRIKGSRHHNMKELRPPSAGAGEVRILFVFDPERHAIMLVAGDKAGNWRGWYERSVLVADRRFDEHLARLDSRRPKR